LYCGYKEIRQKLWEGARTFTSLDKGPPDTLRYPALQYNIPSDSVFRFTTR